MEIYCWIFGQSYCRSYHMATVDLKDVTAITNMLNEQASLFSK